MDISQQSSIYLHTADLCEVLHFTTDDFLHRLKMGKILTATEVEIIQKSHQLNEAKIDATLELIKSKTGAFKVLIGYLRDTNRLDLAGKLERTAVTTTCRELKVGDPLTAENQSKSVIDHFIGKLIKFYLGNFRAVETFGGDSESIESVWVDIQMKGHQGSTANYSDIFTRMSETDCHSTIIEGQPGSGKTTLVKKIAYDWAKHKSSENDKKIPFDLILVVTLRSLQSGADLLEVAVRHLMSGTVNQAEVETTVAALRHSGLKVLLILDGLDEWEIQSSSPLVRIFGSAFNRAKNKRLVDKIDFDFDLMITSRPYACDLINDNFLATRWRIVGLDAAKQSEFVKLRCRTESGRDQAAAYLKNLTILREIGEIPLLLLLVCYLADENIKLPTNLSRLYEAFVHRMLMRSTNKSSIGNIDLEDWRKAELVTSLGRLALLGVMKNKFEFSRDEMNICRVKEESFKSGLLLFRSDPVNLIIKADFAHRSVQEFLAALHCVDFWATDSTITSTTGWLKKIWPIEGISEMKVEMLVAKMIRSRDSQFCRFYFGLLSGQPEFEVQMRKSLEEYADINFIQPSFLWPLSNSLANCSDTECLLTGEIVNSLVDKSLSWNKSGWTEVQLRKSNIFRWTEGQTIDNWPTLTRSDFRQQLQSGLKLEWLGNSLSSISLRSESQSELKMIFIWLDEANLVEIVGEVEGIERVEWLWINQSASFDAVSLKFAFEQIKRLPKCRNCFIWDGSNNFPKIRLWLGRKSEFPVNSGHSGVNPEFIYFLVERSLGEKLWRKLSSLRHSDSGEVKIRSIEQPFSTERRVRLAVSSSSWSVWDFLRSEEDWDSQLPELDSTTRSHRCSLC